MKRAAFFLGKGGVGKTTLASAFALGLARGGERVLVVSLDPAHNLGDALGKKLGDRVSRVEEGLDAMEVDLGSWVERYLEESRRELLEAYSYDLTLNLDSFFGIMRYSPGTEEYAVLWAIEHVYCELAADYDVVVFDTPPTALSLRFLAMPRVSELWVAELAKLRERILERRGTITRLNPSSPVASSCVDKEDDKVYGKLGAIRNRLAGLNRLFREESYLAVVLNPDRLSVSEALRIKEELERLRIPLRALCVNKRGHSKAPWSPDPAFAAVPSFEIDFRSHGLHHREDLISIDLSALAADFHAQQ